MARDKGLLSSDQLSKGQTSLFEVHALMTYTKIIHAYVEVSRNANNGETNAKKLIRRPIMTVTSPNSPHIALTYTKMRFDNSFDHTYPPSWS